ncbi:NlpC/P60-like cell-wall peptidase [Metarhizium acridum CQMa 102]|uniref:NlpC/P60-like cell-wall peptidase n=1 Tax=Metarhizium acridum (strain CQMa 102) TaxID=655827 RepID=E9DV61_METAQ|nr:NlpC/P60-like cell-wall peptidase [Metarhizium acridum CQMa 102]EFY92485.1 NlpC/P60-like cell-wall peptidase [Metarhizium acridum CQMa 102]
MKSSSLFTVFLAAGAYAMPTTAEAEDAGLEKRTGPGIVAAAEKMKGKPYVWGGGDIHGPTNGGFDCSGLTQYSVYQAQKTEIRGGNCKTGVVHVGIFTRPGWMVNAAHTGVPVRDQKIWTLSGGESICPDAVRFW